MKLAAAIVRRGRFARLFSAVAATIITTGCATTTSQPAPLPAPHDCSMAADLDGLRIYLRLDGGWQRFQFIGAWLSDTRLAPSEGPDAHALRNDSGLNVGHSFPERFPGWGVSASGEQLGYPARFSPDRRALAASLMRPGIDKVMPPAALTIETIDRQSSVLIEPRMPVGTLAWAPGSDRLAVVERSYDDTPRSAQAALVGTFGWKMYFNDVALSVYSTSGALLCRSVLVSRQAEVTVLAEWL